MSEYEESGHVCSCGGTCGCGSNTSLAQPSFLTREEYIARLEEYLGELKTEIVSVENELADLRQTA